tara:strand:- start:22962 stop:23558 length:597 start_codon:yes stop_codon:yes gene_type:complete
MTTKKFKVTEYEKVKGSHVRKEDAQEIGEILNSLAMENDGVIPHDVVKAAKSPKSVLHKYFTWDDKEAADKQRLTEAGYIIRNMNMRVVYAQVVVDNNVKKQESREVTVRMLQSTKNDANDGYVYRSTFEVLGDPEKATECYHNMYTYLMGAFRRFHAIDELSEELQNIETILVNLSSKLGKTKKEITNHIARIRRGV